MAEIDPARFLSELHALRAIGAVSTGCVRPAFSDADIEGRRWVAARMVEAGLRPVWDPVGNLFGLPEEDGPWLMTGSHTDTQPEGGWLDGALGVIAGLEAIRAIREAGGPPVALANFQDEEGRFGGLTGSSFFTGARSLAETEALTDETGASLAARRDLVPECVGAAPISRAFFRGFVELHIEQGPVLDTAGEAAAVVEAIVGLRQLTITYGGQQNHAGTTPMHLRRDAVRGLVRFAGALDAALAPVVTPASVWTIGEVQVEPNAGSIVPGRAVFSVQWRDAETARLDAMEEIVRRLASEAGTAEGLEVQLSETMAITPSAMDARLVEGLCTAAEMVAPGRWRRLPSGAIHDAGAVSRAMPSAMLFAPSIGGVSHSLAEDTAEADLVTAAQILAKGLAALA